MRRGIDIEPDDVAELGGNGRIARALEGAQAMRLQVVRPPDALHRPSDSPIALAIARPVQWIAWCGGSVQVSATIRAVVSAAIGALPGLRVLSRNRPSTPASAKRCCQRHTVGRLTPMLWAARCTDPRSVEASTMRARSTYFCRWLRSATIASKRSRSIALTITHTV